MKKFDFINKKFLQKEYSKNRKSGYQIAKELNCSVKLIYDKLKKYGFKLKTQAEWMKGKNHSKKTKEKISEALKGNKYSYIDGRYSKIHYCKEKECNNQINYNTWKYGKKRCRSCSQKRRYKDNPELIKIAINNLPKDCSGEKNGNYNNGKGYEPYSPEFTRKLKETIRKRDNYKCQGKDCSITQEEHFLIYGRDIEIHHIDYDKINCKENNLLTLCKQCNIRANYNRKYWKKFFKEKIIKCKL